MPPWQLVIDQTTITGSIETSIVATFPAVIPQVVSDAGYKINSLITLGAALPPGTTVTVTRNGDAYLTNVPFPGTENWVTDLFVAPLSAAADFTATSYNNQVETYVFTFAATGQINTTMRLQSIISRDLFESELVVLADETFALYIPE